VIPNVRDWVLTALGKLDVGDLTRVKKTNKRAHLWGRLPQKQGKGWKMYLSIGIHPSTPRVLSGEEEGLEEAQPRVPLNADTNR